MLIFRLGKLEVTNYTTYRLRFPVRCHVPRPLCLHWLYVVFVANTLLYCCNFNVLSNFDFDAPIFCIVDTYHPL